MILKIVYKEFYRLEYKKFSKLDQYIKQILIKILMVKKIDISQPGSHLN